MTAYYNENDPKAAAWLRELIAGDHIAYGVVDERSIEDIAPDELAGYTQCHFFAGIGGWSYALRLAGWPDDRPVWTGSCPCQPFSAAGAGGGVNDPRHLFPHWRWLIDQCRPAIVFGEQVASKAGRAWFAGVRADLEALGYGVGAADLCAASAGEEAKGRVSYEDNSFDWQDLVVGAPHIRQRLWWVADTRRIERERRTSEQRPAGAGTSERHKKSAEYKRGGATSGLADDAGSQGRGVLPERADELSPWASSLDNWIPCADGKARRIEPGLEPLASGLPGRVGLLRGYGNAIVPEVAQAFIEACM